MTEYVDDKPKVHICVVSCSQRPNSQSRRVSEYLLERVGKECWSVAETTDLAASNLPFFTGEDSYQSPAWMVLEERIQRADGFVFVVPEWGGMVPPILKNFLLYCENGPLVYKPALIVSISAGNIGGAYPIAELRLSSQKNTRVLYIPDHVIVRNVESFPDRKSDSHHAEVVRRIGASLVMLESLARKLREFRKEHSDVLSTLPYGM